VWDDQSLLNIDFSIICSAYTVQDINQLEKQASTAATIPPHTLHAHATPTARPALPTPWRLRCMLSRAAAAAVSQADRLQRLDHRIALRLLLL
jgi:hypothetical protein